MGKPLAVVKVAGPNTASCLPQGCIKKREITSPKVMGVEFIPNPNQISGANQRQIPGSVRFYAIFFTLRESRRAPDSVLPMVRCSALRLHPWRLGSEAFRVLQHWGELPRYGRTQKKTASRGVVLPAVKSLLFCPASGLGRSPIGHSRNYIFGFLHLSHRVLRLHCWNCRHGFNTSDASHYKGVE